MSEQSKTSIFRRIDIAEIRDGAVLMKDGSWRGILMTNSLNFSLKSSEEQDAITYRYQDFLNSLDFPLQILVVMRHFDVSTYLAMLEEKGSEQENELLKIQVTEYIEFIKGLTQMVNIMSTFFYLVVPFSQIEEKKVAGLGGRFSSVFKKKDKKAKQQSDEQMRTGLWQRLEYLSSGLMAMGLKTVILNTEEALGLYYQLYNPEAKGKPKFELQTT